MINSKLIEVVRRPVSLQAGQRSKKEMNNQKIVTFFVTLFVMVWFIGCASTPERAVPDEGFRVDVGAICSAIDKNPEGKLDKQEFCAYFKDKDMAAQTFDSMDTKKRGYITKEDLLNNQQRYDQVIRLTTPSR